MRLSPGHPVEARAGGAGRARTLLGSSLALLALTTSGCLSLDAGGGGGASGPFTELVLDRLTLPTNTTTADALAFDLDGVGSRRDNALGNVIGLLTAFGLDLQPTLDESIASGDVVILSAIQAASLESGSATWQVYLGEAAASPPAFDGTDAFTRSPSGPTNALLRGTITGGEFSGGPANVVLLLKFDADQAPLVITLIGARIMATVSATGVTMGVLGGAISRSEVEQQIIPAVARTMTEYMLTDCTCADAGPPACTATSPGETLDTMFNATHDCAITGEELLAHPLVQAGVEPDVDMLNGTSFGPGRDGEPDSLSLGVGFTAVGALFDRVGE